MYHTNSNKIFSIDMNKWKDLPNYFNELHNLGMKAIIELDPYISASDSDYRPFIDGKNQDVFIKHNNRLSDNEKDSNLPILKIVIIKNLCLFEFKTYVLFAKRSVTTGHLFILIS